MAFVWLYNDGDEASQYMYDGHLYRLEPKEYLPVSLEAADHLVWHLGARGVKRSDPPKAPVKTEPVVDSILCPFCKKDFTDREKPIYSLKQHLPKCPSNIAVAEEAASTGE